MLVLTFESIISLASVQIYIQIVTLCNYNNNNNVRKQIRMAFEYGLFSKQVSKDKVYASKRFVFNLTRMLLTKMHCFQAFCLTDI